MRLLAVALVLASAQAAEVPAPPEFGEVRRFITDAIDRKSVCAASVAVVRDDRLAWAEGFGAADLETGRKATADSIYLLASVSKPLTATGLMTLVDRGLVDLDRPANAYLPGAKLRSYVGSADEMTIRRMANHTSGMPTHFNFFYEGTAPPPWDLTISRYGFAIVKPGTRQEYSNLAFGLLGFIIETVGRAPLGKFLEGAVFDPLGMPRTSDHVRPGRENDATRQYTTDAAGRIQRVPPYRFDHPAASTMWSSAPDLARFLRAHLNDGALDGVRVLKPESARTMRTPVDQADTSPGYGVGWRVDTFLGEKSISHTGGMPGVATLIRAFPGRRSALVVLTNSDNRTFVTEAGNRLARVLVPGASAPAPKSPSEAAPPPPDAIGQWRGRMAHFEGEIPLLVKVGVDGSVEVQFAGRERQKLRDTAFENNTVGGSVEALLRTRDDYHGIPLFRFRLWRDGNRMTGFAMAQAPGYFGLSHWVSLERER